MRCITDLSRKTRDIVTNSAKKENYNGNINCDLGIVAGEYGDTWCSAASYRENGKGGDPRCAEKVS